jgi:hypothetical protein
MNVAEASTSVRLELVTDAESEAPGERSRVPPVAAYADSGAIRKPAARSAKAATRLSSRARVALGGVEWSDRRPCERAGRECQDTS